MNAVHGGYDYVCKTTKYVCNTTKSFFTKTDNHFTYVVGSAKGRDALMKCAIAILESAEEGFLTNASAEVSEVANNVTEGLKFSRVVFGFFQIFTGEIPKFYESAKKSVECFLRLFKPVENSVKEDRFETVLKLVKEVSDAVANFFHVLAFGVSGPIGCAEQLSKHKFSGATHWIVKQFGFCRMINAGCKSVGSVSTLFSERHHYRRGGIYVVDDKNRIRYERLLGREIAIGAKLQGREKFVVFHSNVDVAFRALLDRGSQFSGLVIKLANIPAPVGLKLGINLFSGGIGIYNVWVDMRGEIADKKELDNYRRNR